jgi:hypothetical protein
MTDSLGGGHVRPQARPRVGQTQRRCHNALQHRVRVVEGRRLCEQSVRRREGSRPTVTCCGRGRVRTPVGRGGPVVGVCAGHCAGLCECFYGFGSAPQPTLRSGAWTGSRPGADGPLWSRSTSGAARTGTSRQEAGQRQATGGLRAGR